MSAMAFYLRKFYGSSSLVLGNRPQNQR